MDGVFFRESNIIYVDFVLAKLRKRRMAVSGAVRGSDSDHSRDCYPYSLPDPHRGLYFYSNAEPKSFSYSLPDSDDSFSGEPSLVQQPWHGLPDYP